MRGSARGSAGIGGLSADLKPISLALHGAPAPWQHVSPGWGSSRCAATGFSADSTSSRSIRRQELSLPLRRPCDRSAVRPISFARRFFPLWWLRLGAWLPRSCLRSRPPLCFLARGTSHCGPNCFEDAPPETLPAMSVQPSHAREPESCLTLGTRRRIGPIRVQGRVTARRWALPRMTSCTFRIDHS